MEALTSEIAAVLGKKRVALKRFQQSLLGKRQHASRVVPAAKSAFPPLIKATQGDPKEVGAGKTSKVCAALVDLKHVVLSLASKPRAPQNLQSMSPKWLTRVTRLKTEHGSGAASNWLCDNWSGRQRSLRCTNEARSRAWTWKWQERCCSASLPNGSNRSSSVTRPSGQTTPHALAGPPKWQTRQPPPSMVSSFKRWSCNNAARLSPL